MFQKNSQIKSAWSSLRSGFAAIAFFSLILNILMLGGPLYMLQVYDRVLTSQNMDTLIALSRRTYLEIRHAPPRSRQI